MEPELKEFHFISKKLFLFLSDMDKNKIQKITVFDIYNNWSEKTGINVKYHENVKWAIDFITDIKKNNNIDPSIIHTLF